MPSDHVTLIGTEDVQRAANRIDTAAETMRCAASQIDEALQRHQRFLDEWLQGFERVLSEWKER